MQDSVEAGSLVAVRELQVCQVELPHSIGALTNLKKLYIGGCESLCALPSSIGEMASLTALYVRISGGKCTIPDSIGNLVNLQELEIAGFGELSQV